MDTPILTGSNGLKPTETTSYTLNCSIATSNPNPVTRYVWFQNNMKIDNKSAILSFRSVKRENSGSWICGGIINQSGILIEKNSTDIQVNVFCKWFHLPNISSLVWHFVEVYECLSECLFAVQYTRFQFERLPIASRILIINW